MSVVEYNEYSSFHTNADNTPRELSNADKTLPDSSDVLIDPACDGILMLSPDLHLFGDAEERSDGRKIFHIFERAPDDDESCDDFSYKHLKKEKEELMLKACQSSFKNIEEIMLKNGIFFDEWCPPLSENRLNSRNNTTDTSARQRTTASLKYFRKYNEKTSEKRGSSRASKNKQGKENGGESCARNEVDKSAAHSTTSKKRFNNNKSKLETKFYCSKCSFCTLYKHNLKTHVLRHCPNRDKSVSGRHDFKNPRTLPVKGRIYLCDMCNYSTPYKRKLNTHKMSHENEKKFICPFCGYGTNILNTLENHIKKKHKDPVKSELHYEQLNCSPKSSKKNHSDSEDILNPNSLKLNTKTNDKVEKDETKICSTDESFSVRNASDIGTMNMNCAVVLKKCIDLHANESVCVNVNDKIISRLSYETEIKEEIQTDRQNDDEICKGNGLLEVKTEIVDEEEKISSSLEIVKEEIQNDSEKDDEICRRNELPDVKTEIVDEEEKISSSLEIVKRENEFSQDIKQETERPNIYFSSSSFSPLNNQENLEVKFENLEPIEKKEITLRQERRKTKLSNNLSENQKELHYEVVKNTTGGTSTILFKSLVCSYTTDHKYKIIQHGITHKKNKTYKCLDCPFTAKCLFLLKLHKKTHFENTVSCPLCPFITRSILTLKKHKWILHRVSNTCTYTALKLRKRSAKSKGDFKCKMCFFMTSNENQYREHMETHSNVSEIKIRSSSNVISASKISEKQKKCTKKQASQRSSVSSTKIKKIVAKNDFKCDKCTFTANSKEKLVEHERGHLRLYKKRKFDKDSSDGSSKDNHENIFRCDNCSFTSPLKIAFLKHKQMHVTSKPGIFKCTECSFSTSKSKLHVSHLMNHAYEHLYRCIHCNFSSNNKSLLKLHAISHKNLRMKTNWKSYRNNRVTPKIFSKNNRVYKCFRCDYSCSSEHLLNQHSLVHFESKLLKCAHCDYETNFKGNLVKHVLIHIDEYIIN